MPQVSNVPSQALLSALSLFDRNVRLEHFFDDSSAKTYSPSPAALELATQTLSWCEEKSATLVYPGHHFYPAAFLQLESPPLFLSCLGPLEQALGKPTRLAVVGTREPSRRAIDWLDQHLGRFLASRHAVVVSGGARGIDQKAHAVAIRSRSPTLIFLPSGLNAIYPAELAEWRDSVFRSGGAFISAYAPDQEVRKHHFESRNRLIAALGQIVFVVEARRRSGSIMTARLAQELGRTLAVLPSFPGEAQSSGTLDLLFNGAFPLRDTEDLLTLFDLSRIS